MAATLEPLLRPWHLGIAGAPVPAGLAPTLAELQAARDLLATLEEPATTRDRIAAAELERDAARARHEAAT